jgi:hypothetical protein
MIDKSIKHKPKVPFYINFASEIICDDNNQIYFILLVSLHSGDSGHVAGKEKPFGNPSG